MRPGRRASRPSCFYGAVAGVDATLVALNTVGATVTISLVEARRPDGQNRQMVLYRYFLPLAASVVLLTGAVGIDL